MAKFIIYADGGSRGNPGPGAAAVVFADEKGRVLKEKSHYLGEVTNNQAEYEAVLLAFREAKILKALNIEIRLDSELIGRQLKGEYKIKDENLQPLFLKAWNAGLDFDKVEFRIVPRAQNKRADKLVNQELDKRSFRSRLF